MLRIGQILYGFCNGYFGRDSYEDKRVEGIGKDWVVAREVDSGQIVFTTFEDESELYEYTENLIIENNIGWKRSPTFKL